MRFFIFIVALALVLGSATVFYLDALSKNAPPPVDEGPSRLDLLRAEAEKGEPVALTKLAERYRRGRGVARDLAAAHIFFEQAAKRGYAPAQMALGEMHEKGEGTRQNYNRAAHFYGLAGERGKLAEALYALGLLYSSGRGVPNDHAKAQNLYKRAAERGHPVAQYLIGNQYEHGWGVQKSAIQAVVWYTLSLSDPATVLATDPSYRAKEAVDRLWADMNNYQREEVNKAVEAWRRKSRR